MVLKCGIQMKSFEHLFLVTQYIFFDKVVLEVIDKHRVFKIYIFYTTKSFNQSNVFIHPFFRPPGQYKSIIKVYPLIWH